MDATLRAQADRVVAFMDQAGMAGADFLATSHGGAVALALAANYPERVRNLVLHAPANPYCTLGVRLINFYLSRLGTWFAYRVPHLPRPMQALALGRMYGDPAKLREGALAKYTGSLRIPGTIAYVLSMLKTWKRDMRALEQQLRETLPSRALLVWGDRDRAVSLSSGQRLQQCFRTAELVVLPGTGHLPYEECPEQLVGAVNGFLSRIRSAVKTGPRLVADPA
jgi:pimeloyl-ACP methyl ester carboxylesterase